MQTKSVRGRNVQLVIATVREWELQSRLATIEAAHGRSLLRLNRKTEQKREAAQREVGVIVDRVKKAMHAPIAMKAMKAPKPMKVMKGPRPMKASK